MASTSGNQNKEFENLKAKAILKSLVTHIYTAEPLLYFQDGPCTYRYLPNRSVVYCVR